MWRSQKVVTISQRGNPQQGQRQNCSAGWFQYPVSQGWVYRAEHIQELQSNPKAQGDTPAYSYYSCTRDKVGCGSRKCKSYFKAMSCVPQALLSLWKAKQEKFRWYYLMEWQFLWGTQGILDWKGPQGLSKSNFWPATGQSLRVTPRARALSKFFLNSGRFCSASTALGSCSTAQTPSEWRASCCYPAQTSPDIFRLFSQVLPQVTSKTRASPSCLHKKSVGYCEVHRTTEYDKLEGTIRIIKPNFWPCTGQLFWSFFESGVLGFLGVFLILLLILV